MTRLYTCCYLAFVGKDELAATACTEGSGTLSPTPTVCSNPTFTPAQTPISALGLLNMFTDMNLQKATKLALELFVKG